MTVNPDRSPPRERGNCGGVTRILMRLVCLGGAMSITFPLEGQRHVVIPDRETCVRCTLTVDTIARLGSADGGQLFNNYPSVQRDSRGRFVVFASIPQTTLHVFDSAGREMDSWGRDGDGPGEFRGIWKIKPLHGGDSLLVVDRATRRITVLDRDGRFARAVQLPLAPLDLHILPANLWIIAGVDYTAEYIGYPLHALSPRGQHRASFGGNVAVVDRQPSLSQRIVGGDHNGVWTSRPDRYELEYWSGDGTHMVTIDRVAAWIPDRDVEQFRNDWRQPIPPRLRDIFVDAMGHVWVLGTSPKADWKPSPANWGSGVDLDEINLDTVVEVIDPQTGTLLISRRFPWIAMEFTEEGDLVSYHHDTDGVMVLQVLRVTLERRAR